MKFSKKMAILMAFLFISKLSAAALSGSLVGIWRHEDEGGFTVIQFHETGKFDGRMERKELGNVTFNGRWRLENDKLVYEYVSPWPGGVDFDRVIELRAAYYEIRAQDGSVRRYVRINTGSENANRPNQKRDR